LLILAVTAGLIIVLLVGWNLFKISSKPASADKPYADLIGSNPTSLPAMPENPMDIVNDPLKVIGMKVLTNVPEDIIAPEGAVRGYAIRRNVPGGWVDIVNYHISIDLQTIEEFYKTQLARRNYKLAQRRSTLQKDGISLVFIPINRTGKVQTIRRYYQVGIRPEGDNVKKITLIVFRSSAKKR